MGDRLVRRSAKRVIQRLAGDAVFCLELPAVARLGEGILRPQARQARRMGRLGHRFGYLSAKAAVYRVILQRGDLRTVCYYRP